MSSSLHDRASNGGPSAAEPVATRLSGRSGAGRPCGADESPPHPAPASPLLLVLTVMGGGYALLFLAAIVAQAPVKLLDTVYLGLDFNDFWTAASDVVAGRDPYLRPRFVTPPLSYIPFLPLSLLSRPQATLVFFGVDAASLAVGIWALVRSYRLAGPLVPVLALICAFSPATLMLLDRGNLDGLVFLPLCVFIALPPGRPAGPLALAVATCLKLYPAVFVLALVAHRRMGAALIVGGAVLATVVLMPAGDLAFLHSQVVRAGGMRIDENLSSLAPFWLLDEILRGDGTTGIGAHPALLTGASLYTAALGTCLWCDAKLVGRVGGPDTRLMLATYAGFCVSMPSLVYLYSGVCLFVPLVALGQPGLSASPRRLRGFALALGLTMLPARSFGLTLGTGWAAALNLVPTIGTFFLLVEAVGLRLDLLLRSAPSGVGPSPTTRRIGAPVEAGQATGA